MLKDFLYYFGMGVLIISVILGTYITIEVGLLYIALNYGLIGCIITFILLFSFVFAIARMFMKGY